MLQHINGTAQAKAVDCLLESGETEKSNSAPQESRSYWFNPVTYGLASPYAVINADLFARVNAT